MWPNKPVLRHTLNGVRVSCQSADSAYAAERAINDSLREVMRNEETTPNDRRRPTHAVTGAAHPKHAEPAHADSMAPLHEYPAERRARLRRAAKKSARVADRVAFLDSSRMEWTKDRVRIIHQRYAPWWMPVNEFETTYVARGDSCDVRRGKR
jgi:hypothetical protein